MFYMWNLADVAYFAGLFDGEGYINVRDKGVALRVQMRDPEPVKWLQDTFGGRVYVHRTKAYDNRPVYAWFLAPRRPVLELVRAALPYLRVKREEAEALIVFNEFRAERLEPRTEAGRARYAEYNRLRDAIHAARHRRHASYV